MPSAMAVKTLLPAAVAIALHLHSALAHAPWEDSLRMPLTARTATCSQAMFQETPRQTPGPFLIRAPDRRNITEGRPGAPLALTIRAVDRNCVPVRNAVIAIWQTDADGLYSGFETRPNGPDTAVVNATGNVFMRGEQTADENGQVTFNTLIPGWYAGRSVHIHFLVFYGDELPATTSPVAQPLQPAEPANYFISQLYFKNEFLADVFEGDAYESRGPPRTFNEDEGVPDELILDVVKNPTGGYKATYNVSIDFDFVEKEGAGPPVTSTGAASTTAANSSTTEPQSAAGPVTTTGATTTNTTTTNPTTTNGTRSEQTETGSAACFPANAKVELEDGRTIEMHSLAVGDRVHVGHGVFEDVFAFTHKMPNVETDFLRIRMETDEELSVSPGHYLLSAPAGSLKVAREFKLGDELFLGSGSLTKIAEISRYTGKGLFNPQILGLGNIVVDGVLASTYTEAVNPRVAHALLAPLRSFYTISGGVDLTCALLDNGAKLFV